jgi:hypothetical protein
MKLNERKERLTPVLGSASRMVKCPETFNKPLSKAELRLWEEGDEKDPLRKYAPENKKRRR